MEGFERRLAAVWFADIVDYTQLSSKNEDVAFALVNVLQERGRTVIAEQGGRLVKSIGDAILAEFRSTEAAVQAALALRDRFEVESRNLGCPAQLRIGLHVGDVKAAADGDVYGDGVNTAARLQGVAEPGQIVVSQDVWRHLRPRAEYQFESLGERRLKGIAGVVWAFSVDRLSDRVVLSDPELKALPHPPVSRRLLNLVGAGGLYAAAALLIIQLIGALRSAWALPEWIMPAAFVLLGVGLIVVLVTSWMESRPAWRQSLTARPHPWYVGLGDLADAISRRRLPEMTWQRAIWGGVAVFSLLLGMALVQSWLERMPSTVLRPQAAHAVPSPAVAILPFATAGTDDLWSEGILDLMALSLDASHQLRVINPRTVLHRLPDPGIRLAPEDLYALAEGLGARYTITGQLVRVDDRITLQAEVHDVLRRQRLGVAMVDGTSDRMAHLVDLLATRALAVGLGSEVSLTERPPLSRLTTGSIPALQAYLRGEQLYRRSRSSQAREAFQESVQRDPTFALALYRLALTEAWSELPHRPRPSSYQVEAERHVGRLSERDSLLIIGLGQLNREDRNALATLSYLVQRYPDDVEGWFLLGDARFHLGQGSERALAGEALQQALRLDPAYGPAYLHLIDEAVAAQDTAQVRQWLMAYRRVDPGSPLLSGFDWALQLSQTQPPPATPPEATAAEESPPQRPPPARGEQPAPRREPTAPQRAPEPAVEAARPNPAVLARLDSLARAVQQRMATPRLDPAAVREANAWVEAARQARAANHFAQAEAHYRQAASVLASARVLPPPDPPAARPAVPAERTPEPVRPERADVEVVLAALEGAIEAKDVSRIRQVWTNLTAEEVDRFRRSLPGMRSLDVSFQILDISPAGEAAVVRVQTTYAFETGRGQQERQSFGQIFRIARSNGEWVIVDSASP